MAVAGSVSDEEYLSTVYDPEAGSDEAAAGVLRIQQPTVWSPLTGIFPAADEDAAG
jgi:hypothetical protein